MRSHDFEFILKQTVELTVIVSHNLVPKQKMFQIWYAKFQAILLHKVFSSLWQ